MPDSSPTIQPAPPRLLIIDDETAICESLIALLSLEGFSADAVHDGPAGLERLAQSPYDLVLLDLSLPGQSGLDLLPLILALKPELPVIMITAFGTVGNVVNAIHAGARNFVQKPWDNEKLLADIRSAIAQSRAEQEISQLKRTLRQRYNFENLIGKSEQMLHLFDLVAQVAPSRSAVLIQGEGGAGKELIAKTLHANSPRRDHPFSAVNCASMPPDMLESTLFGHVKGAVASASSARKGLFEAAQGGTLFLDEISSLTLETQAKLLRVLQDRRILPLGAVQDLPVDVRVLAATNIDLAGAIRESRFREDLYYRLNVIHIEIPPLRARREDIPLLAAHFLNVYAAENNLSPRRLAPETLRLMMDYEWPGNVRELENVIERGVVMASTDEIPPALLPAAISGNPYSAGLIEHQPGVSLFDIMEQLERRIIADRLERCNWNQTDTAEFFKVPLSTLNQKVKRLNIEIKKRHRD